MIVMNEINQLTADGFRRVTVFAGYTVGEVAGLAKTGIVVTADGRALDLAGDLADVQDLSAEELWRESV